LNIYTLIKAYTIHSKSFHLEGGVIEMFGGIRLFGRRWPYVPYTVQKIIISGLSEYILAICILYKL